MKIGISYISTKYYDRTNIIQWVFFFKRYKFVKGFIFRFFGIYVNVREKYATEKLISVAIKRQTIIDFMKKSVYNCN
jgi:hypothetical protein